MASFSKLPDSRKAATQVLEEEHSSDQRQLLNLQMHSLTKTRAFAFGQQ